MAEKLEAERAAFEEFMKTPAPDDYDACVEDAWHIWEAAWQAARRAPADAVDAELPPLPEPRAIRAGNSFPKVYALAYTAEQYRQGQREARDYQRKVDEKIIARRDAEIADLRSQLAGKSRDEAPSLETDKEKN